MRRKHLVMILPGLKDFQESKPELGVPYNWRWVISLRGWMPFERSQSSS
ncbi:hypothetical protein [Thermococcus sp.]|nr:hypothetical protein [Thermococcus sp.]